MKYQAVILVTISIVTVFGQRILNENEKQALLNRHNSLRAGVTPTASNMIKMEWNDELATIAQNYASRRVYGHNDARSVGSSFTYVGENIGLQGGSEESFRDDILMIVQSWYDEVKDYTYSSGCNSGAVCGHYTQVVWAKSVYLGCGAIHGQISGSGLSPDPFTGTYLVCNYGPGGNFNNEKPYQLGESCSECPSDRSCENKLCVSNGGKTTGGEKGNRGGKINPDRRGRKPNPGTGGGTNPRPTQPRQINIRAMINFLRTIRNPQHRVRFLKFFIQQLNF